MINAACQRPAVNANAIATIGREILGLDPPQNSDSVLSGFQINVAKDLIAVQGRVIMSPNVTVKEQNKPKKVPVSQGGWNMARRAVVRSGRKIACWTWLAIDCPRQAEGDLRRWVVDFKHHLVRNMNLSMDEPIELGNNHFCDSQYDPYQLIKTWFTNFSKLPAVETAGKLADAGQGLPAFVCVVLGSDDTHRYNNLKILADTEFGIHTVCVLRAKALKPRMDGGFDPQYMGNVGLKWNLKAGGGNHGIADPVDILKQATMVVGFDVTHPTNMPSGVDPDHLPSIAAIVSSIDNEYAQWPSHHWNQQTRREMASPEHLSAAFIERLELWRKHNKKLPDNVVVFRDGVSEGQFSQVLKLEVPMMREAFKKLYKGAPPKLTVVVAVKRHQTRFYVTQPNADRNQNTLSGTVVDRGVTHARYWSFYLQAHAALQGTSYSGFCPASNVLFPS